MLPPLGHPAPPFPGELPTVHKTNRGMTTRGMKPRAACFCSSWFATLTAILSFLHSYIAAASESRFVFTARSIPIGSTVNGEPRVPRRNRSSTRDPLPLSRFIFRIRTRIFRILGSWFLSSFPIDLPRLDDASAETRD